MRQTNGEALLRQFIQLFAEMWSNDRLLIRRINGLAALDAEFAAVVEARNGRRKTAALRVVERLGAAAHADQKDQSSVLYAITSFEFFDVLFDSPVEIQYAIERLLHVAWRAMQATKTP